MPNWVRNTLYIEGPATAAAALRKMMTTAENEFDFNAIIPMPEVLRTSEASSTAETAWELKYGDWGKNRWRYGPDQYPSREAALAAARAADEWRPVVYGDNGRPLLEKPPRSFDELADAVQANIESYGHADWYSWANIYWGTKWPAIEGYWWTTAQLATETATQVVEFTTAYDGPVPLLASLSQRFPTLTLRMVSDDLEQRMVSDDLEQRMAFLVTVHRGNIIGGRHEMLELE